MTTQEILTISFLIFQYCFRSSRSTADLLTVVSNRIAILFNRSVVTEAVAIDISKAFDRVLHADLLHKIKSYGISGQIFGLLSVFLNNRQLWDVQDGKFLQEYPVNAAVLKALFLVLHFSYYTFMTMLSVKLLMMLSVKLLSMLMILLSTLSDLWQHLELATELESDLQNTIDWHGMWLLDFNPGKTQLILFDWSNNFGVIDVKMDVFVPEEK